MANDVQRYDGFRYEIEEAGLWNSERGQGKPVVILKLIDDERGAESHAYFTPEAFDEFVRDCQGDGIIRASGDYLRRLGA